MAELYNISRLMIRKWQDRSSFEGASHRSNKMHTRLTPESETIVMALMDAPKQIHPLQRLILLQQ